MSPTELGFEASSYVASDVKTLAPDLSSLSAFDPSDPNYATLFVDRLLVLGREHQCSDIHLQPEIEGELSIRWRLDGVLQEVGRYPRGQAADIVTRLKVLAELLTYRTDAPQEGRIRLPDRSVEMRVSTIPTIFGERAVVRVFAAAGDLVEIDQLGLPKDVLSHLDSLLRETSGAILITGPAGSGKTTTAYACLRQLVSVSGGGRSIVSLEDPVEVVVPGVSQSQTNPTADFSLTTGLKSILRQDPEVIFVGEIRDRQTAEVALQAALTGQLVITTFHAGSAAEAVSRLIDMGLEPYQLRSALLGIACQRLVRRLCSCDRTTDDEEALLGLPLKSARVAVGCEKCRSTGYSGRMLLAELLLPRQGEIGQAILAKQEASAIEGLATENGMTTLWSRAIAAVQDLSTSPEEVRRVLGLRLDQESSQ